MSRVKLNLTLIGLLMFSVLFTVNGIVNAIDQSKQGCIDPSSCFRAETWGVWQEGQYSYTKSSNNDSFYYLGTSSRGWMSNGSSYYLHTSKANEKWWGSQTANTFISEWQGQAITKHSAQWYPNGSSGWGYLYTSEQSGWDSATCWNNPNGC